MPPSKTENIDWINSLRIVALYAVIVLHCTSLLLIQYGKVSMNQWMVADFLNAITRFAVPAFVMVTGALSLRKEYEIGDFLKKRLLRVVIPFLFWSLVYVWYSWYNEEIAFTADIWANVKLVLHALRYGSSYHLWYVYMLIGLYFFMPVIGKFVRHATEKELLYFLVVWFAAMLITQPYMSRFITVLDMHYFAGFAGYLVLGYYLAFKDFKIRYLSLWMALLAIIMVVAIAAGSRWLAADKRWPATMFYEPVNPFTVLLSAGIFMLFKQSTLKISAWLVRIRDFAGKYNYGIYLAHALVLYFLEDPLGISYKLCTPIISIPLTAFICFVITLLLVWLINKIPFIGKWISG